MDDNLLNNTDELNIDDNKNYLEELVGEGKKFKSPEELAKGKATSDSYIKILEHRLDQMRMDFEKEREENITRARIDELLDQIKSKPAISELPNAKAVEVKPSIDPKEIESLVSTKIQEHENSKRQTENFNIVRSKLKERYGDKFQSVLKEQMDSMGLSESFVNDLARNHPSVFTKTFGLDVQPQQQNFQTPPSSQRRNDTFAPKTEKRTWTYYQNLKKTQPEVWRDPKTAVQMQIDYANLGTEFEDGDFHSV